MLPSEQPIDTLLRESRCGDDKAYQYLIPLVYERLRSLAAECLDSERPNHTLRPTDLVHEVYLKLVTTQVDWRDKFHFYTIASRMMRQILVDYARRRKRQKRGGDMERISIDTLEPEGAAGVPGLDEIDLALDRLAKIDERKAQVVELLYFGGLTYDEVSSALSISVATIDREVRMAKAWLRHELSNGPDEVTDKQVAD